MRTPNPNRGKFFWTHDCFFDRYMALRKRRQPGRLLFKTLKRRKKEREGVSRDLLAKCNVWTLLAS